MTNNSSGTEQIVDYVKPGSNWRREGAHAPERSPMEFEVNEQGETLWKSNPFWTAFELPTKKQKHQINEDNVVAVNTRTGDETNTAAITKIIEVDSDPFVKVFTRHLTVFFDLKGPGQRLVQYLFDEIGSDPNEDHVYMSAKAVVDYHKRKKAEGRGKGFSAASYYRGRTELIEKGFIAASTRTHVYWFNPALFWNGDRIKFITELKAPDQVIEAGAAPDAGADAIDITQARPS